MIKVTRFNGAEMVVNAEMIEFVEATPDTVITLSNGKKILVKEKVDEVVSRVMRYREQIGLHLTAPGEDCPVRGKE